MNIFLLSDDIKQSVTYYVDVHVRKILIETAQLLANCYRLDVLEQAPKTQQNTYRKHTNPKHPWCEWTKQNISNFYHVLEYNYVLNKEYEYRFNKNHFCKEFGIWASEKKPHLSYGEKTPPPLCMPDHYKSDNIIDSYRTYYKNDKMTDKNGKPIDFWTKREKPYWI